LESNSKTARGFAPLAWLVALAVIEIVLNRGVVPMISRSHAGAWWLTALDYAALFSFYFATTLALVQLGITVFAAWPARRTAPAGWLLGTAVIGLMAMVARAVISAGSTVSLLLDVALMLLILAVLLFAWLNGPAGRRDWGIRIGLIAISVPLLVHCVAAAYAGFISLDAVAEGKDSWQTLGLLAMCGAAIVAPYCFAPRPFANAVVRIVPVVVAMSLATGGALLLRNDYVATAKLVDRTLGVEISAMRADPKLALYLLSLATMLWTVISAATAPAPARRQVGIGLLLIVLGGNGYRWPLNYLLIAVGLTLIAYATTMVREQERLVEATPSIDDGVWSTYVASLAKALKTHAPTLHVLSTRDADADVSTLLIGETDGMALRVRMARRQGSLEMVDVLVGREPRRTDAPALLMFGQSPAGTPVSVPLLSGTRSTVEDDRIDIIGPVELFAKLRGDQPLPGAALVDIPGWIGYWRDQAIGWRVLPGRDASLDSPVPIHDLAHAGSGKAAAQNAERLVAVVTTLIALARRGDVPRAATSDASDAASDAASSAARDVASAAASDEP